MSQKKTKISTSDVSVTPNGKKLVQARLPFKTLASTPKVGIDSLVTGESRKRKLSTTEDDNRSIKLSKTGGAKENIMKTDEVTVLEMVDLVEDDVIMTENDISSAAELTKQTKKSTKALEVEEKEKDVQLRRSNRKNDSEIPTKVVIKIPSAKKKKTTERPIKATVVSKIDENVDDDDDVIPIDSGENSLTSVDGKEKGSNDVADDNSIVLIEDDSSLTLYDDKDSKVVDSNTTVEMEEASYAEENTENTDATTAKENEVLPEENSANNMKKSNSVVVPLETGSEDVPPVKSDANKLDVMISEEEMVSSSSDETDGEGIIKADAKEENLSAHVNETAEVGTVIDQSKVSTPTSSTMERRTRKPIDNSLVTTPKTSALKTSDNTSLTPKQLQRKLESEQKRLAKEKAKEERERKIQEAKEERERKLQEAREERERKIQEAKEERDRKLQEEKEQRQKERDEKERQKKKERDDKEEQKRKEREDKEEQRRKEREEREKKKQAEIDAKNEEKRQKEEERVAKEEAELKKKRKEAEAFTKFFAKKSSKSAESEKMDVDEIEVKNFMPFRVKPDMRLAPIVRCKLSPTRKSKFDGEVFNSTHSSTSTGLYIHSLRNGSHVSEKQGKTWPSEDNNDDDVMIVDDLEGGTPIEETSAVQKYRAKFFKFEENRRPPYYGTWRKKSSVIKPRKPFVTDQKYFDYEVDSDDEWEDEEPGESLHGSDDEKDKESDDDYDIDNEFFVPHGHLSDEELANNDEIDDDNSPDTQKAKLKIMQKVFSDEMKKKTEKIKPRLVGLIWQNKDGSQPLVCPNVIWEMLQMRSMIFNGPSIVMPVIQDVDKNDAFDESESKKNSAIKKRVKLTEEVVSDLLRLTHGNTNSCEFLSKEFRAFTAQKNEGNDKFQEFSLASIRLKIKELAEWKPCPEEGSLMNKYCWYVSNEQRQRYNMESLSIINDWKYILTPKTKLKSESKKVKESDKSKSPPEAGDDVPSAAKTPKSKLGNIQKFTKVLSDDEKKRNFSIPVQESPLEIPSPKPKPSSDAEPSPKPVKKRVNLLMSVPRGQEIPVQTKNSLISQYLSSTNKKSTDADETICID